MKEEFEIKHDLWKEELLASPAWEALTVFGPRFKGFSGPVKPLLDRITNAQKFEKEIIQLCAKFNFNIERPYDEFGLTQGASILIQAGKIELPVAHKLLELMNISLKNIAQISQKLNEVKKNNATMKSGPPGVPLFFAKAILVAIELQRDSPEGLSLLRNFIEPKGELEAWLNERKQVHEITRLIITSTGDSGNIKDWASKKKQILERASLGANIKSISGHEERLEELRNEISKSAKILDKK